ncbi:MAG: lytic murein transglycosylase B [Roseivirga sp.]|nr:lytic murein transglycosylase B [Roseivirga sp.]
MLKKLIPTLLLFFISMTAFGQIDKAQVAAFAKEFSEKNDLPLSEVTGILDQAEFQQEIIDKISRPAEGTMTWGRYRKIFMTPERVEAGVVFWNEHAEALRQVSADTGVAEEVILGIIGVETYFGRIKGSYRVLDALYTLAFGYPKRSRFFTKELGHFLELAKAENLEVTGVLGSYAGAMGYSQFMPSSYKAYARSFDKGGTSDLIDSPEDAIASVANYLKVHRWKTGQPITSKATMTREISRLRKQSLRPKNKVSDYTAIGFKPATELPADLKATMIILENENDTEHWFGLENFYVITRYNHSKLYAMAVTQLSQEIKTERGIR